MSTMTDTQGRRTRRSFTDDYKTGAVRLVLDEGKTVASAARDLGLTESSLRHWVEQARADRTKQPVEEVCSLSAAIQATLR